jgi:hypothetical protein
MSLMVSTLPSKKTKMPRDIIGARPWVAVIRNLNLTGSSENLRRMQKSACYCGSGAQAQGGQAGLILLGGHWRTAPTLVGGTTPGILLLRTPPWHRPGRRYGLDCDEAGAGKSCKPSGSGGMLPAQTVGG